MSIKNMYSRLKALLLLFCVGNAVFCAPVFAQADSEDGRILAPIPFVDWDETHVRRVLHTFAFGGLATDAQIASWASMSPELAITEMLTFDLNNVLLSPPEDLNAAKCTSPERPDGLSIHPVLPGAFPKY